MFQVLFLEPHKYCLTYAYNNSKRFVQLLSHFTNENIET